MHVALDATPLTLSSGGLRRYTIDLSLALAREFPLDRFVLMSDQNYSLPPAAPSNLIQGRGPSGPLARRWWLWGAGHEMSRQGTEIFHGTDFAVPYLPRRPSVLTLHDLSPWMNPAWHSGADRVRARTPLLLGLRLAAMVITCSQAVRAQAIERFGLHPSRVVSVPLAASCLFRPVATPPTGRPYFLFVGTLEPRKNIPLLIEAWREVRAHHDVDLLLAGRRRADFGTLPEHSGLKWLGEVPDSELPALYSGALAMMYPSCYEGFGLPVLEAMSCGACVITSGDPALRELAGGASLQVSGPRQLAHAMTAVINHPALVAERRERSLARARLYSWRKTARLTRDVYVEALRRGL
jgi:glycosyltransferase involved in cell wall biosynthesis